MLPFYRNLQIARFNEFRTYQAMMLCSFNIGVHCTNGVGSTCIILVWCGSAKTTHMHVHVCLRKPPKEVLTEYTSKVDLLKGILEAEKLVCFN